jgi:putative FmdB family regulatory protein
MPTYEYKCEACGQVLEIFQPITEKPLKKCSACGALKLKRLIGGGGGIIFKGSGFYQTDYRSAGYKKRAAEDSSAMSATSGKACASCKESKNCPASKE